MIAVITKFKEVFVRHRGQNLNAQEPLYDAIVPSNHNARTLQPLFN